jgi:hypothetical protein
MNRPKYLVVLPYVVNEWADRCLSSSRLHEEGRVLTVDNTVNNVGIMRAHNMALDMRAPDEWLIVLSAALEFGSREGGLDFIDNLATHGDTHGVISASGTFGWHMVGFHPDVCATMGRWDENFTPYGYDDLDLSIRIHKLMPDLIWGGYPIMVKDHGMAHSLKVGGVETIGSHRLLNYWHRKWGAAPGSEFDAYWDHPFNSVVHHLNYWPDINGARWDGPAPA